MKRNINLLQSEQDLSPDILNQAQKEYILQALANLGQRMGIKGDGLAYRSFSFLDLINDESSEYSLSDYIGYVDYKVDEDNNPIGVFGLNNIKTNTDKIIDSLTTKSINNILYFDRELSFTIPVSGIEKYAKGSIISNENNVLTIITVGKMIGFEDSDIDNSVLLYYKYDISSNKLIYIAKLRNVYNDNKSSYYSLLRLYRDHDAEDNIYINKFNLDIQIFNANILGDIYKNSFTSLFQYSNYEDSSDMGFAFLRPEFIDLDTLEGTTSYNPDKTNNFDSNSPIAIVLNNIENTNYYNKSTLKLEYDSTKNEFICTSDNYENIISLYKNEYHFVDLEEEVYNINDDISELYRNMFSYYNEKFYIENRVRFFKRILCKLYETLSEDNKNGRLYIPINYDINYICNSNNELNIYYSNDIYVLLTNLNEKYDREEYLSNDKYLIFDYEDIDVVKSYKFDVSYNYYIEDLINNVYIKEIYTMPYVNDEENWNINGEDTNIRAVGKDAGNPNIILIYSKDKENTNDSYVLINAIKNSDIILRSGFERKKFLVDNRLFSNLQDKKIYCYAYLPTVNNINKSTLEDAIIINICDLQCLDEELYGNYYIGSNIITLWYYGKENKKFQFLLVKEKDSEYALPLGATVNVSNVLSNAAYNLNSQDLIILRANISKLAQETLGTVSLNWGLIKNKSAYEYAPNKETQDTFRYFNDLNAIIEYTDDLKNIDGTLINLKSEKYVNDFLNIKTTNILYPKYQINRNIVEGTTSTIIQTLERELINNEIIEITVNNRDNILVSDELRDVAADILVNNAEDVVIDVTYKTIEDTEEHYDEYVFNSNVPTFDFKEVFLRNTNNLNRLNIISLDAQGNPYYAYIGTSYDEPDKSTIHFGSIEKNINIGSNSLIDEINRDSFIKHDKLSFDFDKIFVNAGKSFSGDKSYVIEKDINEIHYKMGKSWIFGKAIDPIITYEKIEDIVSNRKKIIVTAESIAEVNFNSVPLRIEHYEENIDKSVYAVCLNAICKNVFNINMDDFKKIKINVGKNKLFVVRYNNSNWKTPIFFMIINDELVQTFDGTNITACTDTVDMICCNTASELEVLDTDTLQIICKFDKYNYDDGFSSEIEWDCPILKYNGALINNDFSTPNELIFYWWVGTVDPRVDRTPINKLNDYVEYKRQNINASDQEEYEAELERMYNETFASDDNDEGTMGWRSLGEILENNDNGYLKYASNNWNIPFLEYFNDDPVYAYVILPLYVSIQDWHITISEGEGVDPEYVQYEKLGGIFEIQGNLYQLYKSKNKVSNFQWHLYYELDPNTNTEETNPNE